MRTRIHNARVISMDPEIGTLLDAEVLIEGSRIIKVGEFTRREELPTAPPGGGADREEVIDAEGKWLLPGFVQPHTHLSQTLFRGLAEDISRPEWLHQ